MGKTVRPEPTSFHDVVKNVLPAVVTIESNQKVSMAKAEIPDFAASLS